MRSKEKEYRKYQIYILSGTILSIMIIAVFAYIVSRITAQAAYDAALEVKRTMLKENVENTISYIDTCANIFLTKNPGASPEETEAAMTKIAHEKIYSEVHIDGTYMWVQKVLDYNGGDNYAIRLIHPNLSDTEGCYLSTETPNPAGIKAYEEELNGVRENGSVYLIYDFKKLNSDDVTTKITYSSLYKRFDWIVCMGVNVDDMEHYQDGAMRRLILPQTLIITFSSLVWLIMLFAMFRAYSSTKGRVYEDQKRELSDKLYWDAVSGANSRIRGQTLLEEYFEHSKENNLNTLVLMLDVDYFKQFNDTYGHAVGDKVLSHFVDAIKMNISDDDAVIRWGGDEFVAVFRNIPHDKQPQLGDNILDTIRNIDLPELDGKQITASMGFAYISKHDRSIEDTLTRADEAVYEAKKAGRNNWNINGTSKNPM